MNRPVERGSRALVRGLVVAAAACAGHTVPAPVPIASCEVGDTALVRDVVYFGRNRPAGGTVSDAE